jgi:hypothetical protein
MKNEPCMCGAADCPKCHPGCNDLLPVGCEHGEARRREVTACYLCGRWVCVECGVCVECKAEMEEEAT